MSGFNLFKRLRSVRSHNQNTSVNTRNETKRSGCYDRDVSLKLLVKDSNDAKGGGDKDSNVNKYFLKGSPSITQEIDYYLEVSKYKPLREKTNNLGFDKVRHKPGCTVTEDG